MTNLVKDYYKNNYKTLLDIVASYTILSYFIFLTSVLVLSAYKLIIG